MLASLYAAMVMMFGSTSKCPDPRTGLSSLSIVFPVVRMGQYSTRADLERAVKEIPNCLHCLSRWQQMIALVFWRPFAAQPFIHYGKHVRVVHQ